MEVRLARLASREAMRKSCYSFGCFKMPESSNAWKKVSPHFYHLSTVFVRHRHSGIRVSPVPTVTDWSGIAKQWFYSMLAAR
jgi:hypothetical protein